MSIKSDENGLENRKKVIGMFQFIRFSADGPLQDGENKVQQHFSEIKTKLMR